MQVFFVYRPTTGDRLIAQGGGVVVIKWANGCRHVVASEAVSVNASEATMWFRNDAIVAARRAVTNFGGAAWDENGRIWYAAPTPAAARAVRLLFAALAATNKNKEEFSRLMIEAGEFKEILPWQDVLPALCMAAPALTPLPCLSIEKGDDGDGHRHLLKVSSSMPADDGDVMRVREHANIKAPDDWVISEVSPSLSLPQEL